MSSHEPKTIRLQDYRPPAFLIDQVELSFELDESQTLVRSRLQVQRNPSALERTADLHLDGEELELLELRLDGRELAPTAFNLESDGLCVFEVPEVFSLEALVRIHPEHNTRLEGLYRSGTLFCTQCEAEGFRRITYFLDRPDVMARFRTRVVAGPGYPVLLSNGNPVGEGVLADGRSYAEWEDPFPKPCYLFALVAGDLRWIEDRFVTCSGREVRLRIYVEPENIERCDHAMASLKKAMAWDEKEFGREYDLDVYNIVAVNDFNMGAMENKGLNVFNAKYVLALPETATDKDYLDIEGVIAHEYFHNWTGNRITCRDWFQLSLKEGLTVFRDQEFSADVGVRNVKRIADVRLLRAHQFTEDAGPMAHPVRPNSYIEINNFYTMTVYQKGAEVVRMQANLLGPETFRKAMDLYFARHDGQAVTTEDFVRCMEDAGQRDLEQFRRWYDLAGTPELSIRGEHDPASGRFRLHVHQQCSDTPGQVNKPPFHLPLAVGLLDSDGTDLPLRLLGEPEPGPTTRVLQVREKDQVFVFEGLAQPPRMSLLRGFSAPVKLRVEDTDEDLMFLMARDSDDFCRWDAAQRLAGKRLRQLVAAHQAGRSMSVPDGFIDAFRTALLDPRADQALLAEVLTLPSELDLGEQMEIIDVEAIHWAREGLKSRLAKALREELLQTYSLNQETGPYEISPAAIGRRALKNLCLDYLLQLEDETTYALALMQLENSHNMTDTLEALSGLANSRCGQREAALESFASRWRFDPLVMDKWFTLQATAKHPGTLGQVKRLMGHPCFHIANPNRVRSLIGAFATANPFNFHASDGAGYAFLVDQVLALDPLNPQIAARLLRGMSRWRRYDAARQALMQGLLQRVLEMAGLSRDVYEIAARSLEPG